MSIIHRPKIDDQLCFVLMPLGQLIVEQTVTEVTNDNARLELSLPGAAPEEATLGIPAPDAARTQAEGRQGSVRDAQDESSGWFSGKSHFSAMGVILYDKGPGNELME